MPPGGNRDIDVPPIPIVAVCTGIFHAQGSRSGGTARSTMRQTRRSFHATLFGYRSPCSSHARFLPLPRPPPMSAAPLHQGLGGTDALEEIRQLPVQAVLS